MKNIPIRQLQTDSKEPKLTEKFSIRSVQDLLAGQDMVQELHRHDFFYVLALEKGSGHHEIDFKPYEICDHCVFFMRPGQVHQLHLKAGSTGYLLQFYDGYYPINDIDEPYILFQRASNTNFYQLDTSRSNKLDAILNYVYQEFTNKELRYEEVILAQLGVFFIELLRQSKQRLYIDINNLYPQERLEDFLMSLAVHYATKKKVTDYADMLDISTFQLNAITKTLLGKNCSEAIKDHIILEAKRYLLGTSNQVSQIADHLGYDDVSYFIRFFKKHTGYTPEVFRNNSR
jgi:AraC-like DNA-binding protein